MAVGPNLNIRVNGITISHLKLRRQLVNGAPVGKLEVVIQDPVLGMFAIDDNEDVPAGAPRFVIEIQDTSIPAAERCKLKSKGWKIISVTDLLSTLESIGAY